MSLVLVLKELGGAVGIIEKIRASREVIEMESVK